MPTPASQLALQGLRDLTTLKWYVIPLLAIIFYIYTFEIRKAKKSGNWDAIYAGLTLFGMRSDRNKIITIAAIYTVGILMNVFGMGVMGWVY